MKGSEFLRKVRALARRRHWQCEWHPDQGKGSHGTLRLNGRLTVLRNLKDELKTGTYHGMLKQLALTDKDFHE